MEVIKQEITRTEITGYRANDGKEFYTEEECLAYEKTAKCAITQAFNQLVIVWQNEWSVFENYGCGSEDWKIVMIHIKDENDLKVANMFSQIAYEKKNKFDASHIGKKLIVGIGDGYDDTPACYVYGTIDELVAKFKSDMEKRFKEDEQ